MGFTHIVENVLDHLREGSVAVDAALIALLLRCGDHMLELIEVVADRGETPTPAALERGEALREAPECLFAAVNHRCQRRHR